MAIDIAALCTYRHIIPYYFKILHFTTRYTIWLHTTRKHRTLQWPSISPHFASTDTLLHVTPRYCTLQHDTPYYFATHEITTDKTHVLPLILHHRAPKDILNIAQLYYTLLHITAYYCTLLHSTRDYHRQDVEIAMGTRMTLHVIDAMYI